MNMAWVAILAAAMAYPMTMTDELTTPHRTATALGQAHGVVPAEGLGATRATAAQPGPAP